MALAGNYDRLGYRAGKTEGRGRLIEFVDAEAKLVLAICEMYNAGVDVSEMARSLISDHTSRKRKLRHRHDWHLAIIYNAVCFEDYMGQTVLRSAGDKE